MSCLHDSSRIFSISGVSLITKYDSYETTYFGINIRDGERYEIIMDYISGT